MIKVINDGKEQRQGLTELQGNRYPSDDLRGVSKLIPTPQGEGGAVPLDRRGAAYLGGQGDYEIRVRRNTIGNG
jgi:hypothetical protein